MFGCAKGGWSDIQWPLRARGQRSVLEGVGHTHSCHKTAGTEAPGDGLSLHPIGSSQHHTGTECEQRLLAPSKTHTREGGHRGDDCLNVALILTVLLCATDEAFL